jgi:hypothetical protein
MNSRIVGSSSSHITCQFGWSEASSSSFWNGSVDFLFRGQPGSRPRARHNGGLLQRLVEGLVAREAEVDLAG